MSKPWSYCPECGSEETQYEEGDHKQCANCHQEWFSDIDYSDVVRKHLSGQHSDKDAVIERLRAELATIRAGQGEAVAYVSEESFSSNGTSDIITCNLPIGTALYTAPPASADAVSVPRELLKRVVTRVILRSQEDAHADACEELRALLAQTESKVKP